MKQAKTRTRDKLTRAMEHLNDEKLSYEQQDVADRQARFILYAAMERVWHAPAAHFRRYNCGLKNEPAATLENHGRDLGERIGGFTIRRVAGQLAKITCPRSRFSFKWIASSLSVIRQQFGHLDHCLNASGHCSSKMDSAA